VKWLSFACVFHALLPSTRKDLLDLLNDRKSFLGLLSLYSFIGVLLRAFFLHMVLVHLLMNFYQITQLLLLLLSKLLLLLLNLLQPHNQILPLLIHPLPNQRLLLIILLFKLLFL
jgi:hypothetical protein